MGFNFDEWAQSWEKSFDSSYKSIKRFHDDIKAFQGAIPTSTFKKCQVNIQLLMAELEEIQEKFEQSRRIIQSQLGHKEPLGTSSA